MWSTRCDLDFYGSEVCILPLIHSQATFLRSLSWLLPCRHPVVRNVNYGGVLWSARKGFCSQVFSALWSTVCASGGERLLALLLKCVKPTKQVNTYFHFCLSFCLPCHVQTYTDFLLPRVKIFEFRFIHSACI